MKQTTQKIYIGTSEKMLDVENESVDFIVTSPPYWNLKNYGSIDEIGSEEYEAYLNRLRNVWQECYRVAKKNAIMVININDRRHKKKFYPIAFDISHNMPKWELWDVMIWYVPNALPQPNHYRNLLFDNKFEYLLIFKKGDIYKFNKPRVPQKYLEADPRGHKKDPRGRCLGNVIRIPAYRPPNVKEKSYHVAAYPEELAALMLETFTEQGDTVLDPFLGSGTSLKVARVMNRNGIGYELNPAFKPLIENKINEQWEVPDWKRLDIFHSTTMQTGSHRPRKSQFDKVKNGAKHEKLERIENTGQILLI